MSTMSTLLDMSDRLLGEYLSNLTSRYVFDGVDDRNVDNLPRDVENARDYLLSTHDIWESEKDTNNSYARIFDCLNNARETCARELRPIPLRKYNLCVGYLESKPPTTPRHQEVPLLRPQTPIRCLLRQFSHRDINISDLDLIVLQEPENVEMPSVAALLFQLKQCTYSVE